MNISLLLIATNKYKKFVQPLLEGVKKYFLLNHQIEVHLFTDDLRSYIGNNRVRIAQHLIPPYGYPEATLKRYEIFTSIPIEKYDDYIFYLDVDMGIIAEVGNEVLGDITAVLHPGYYNGGWGDTETSEISHAYLPPAWRKHYYAGGFQGGSTTSYYRLCKILAESIKKDEEKGVMARWHDESHFNKILNTATKEEEKRRVILNPSYCMPEARWKREAWGLTEFKPIILALEKEEDIRE